MGLNLSNYLGHSGWFPVIPKSACIRIVIYFPGAIPLNYVWWAYSYLEADSIYSIHIQYKGIWPFEITETLLVTTVGRIDYVYTCANAYILICTHFKHNNVSNFYHYFTIDICKNTRFFFLFDESSSCYYFQFITWKQF